MFGLSGMELVFILVLVLLFYGPDKLPEIFRKLGRFTAEMKSASDEMRRAFHQSMHEANAPKGPEKSDADVSQALNPGTDAEGPIAQDAPDPEEAAPEDRTDSQIPTESKKESDHA